MTSGPSERRHERGIPATGREDPPLQFEDTPTMSAPAIEHDLWLLRLHAVAGQRWLASRPPKVDEAAASIDEMRPLGARLGIEVRLITTRLQRSPVPDGSCRMLAEVADILASVERDADGLPFRGVSVRAPAAKRVG